MIEKHTNTPINENVLIEDDFDAIQQMQDLDRQRAAARRIVETEPNQPTTIEKPKSKKAANAAIGAAMTAIAATGLIASTAEAFSTPEFSEETTTYTVQPGDGLYNAAESVLGHETVDTRDIIDNINAHPANIDVLKDGLQPGEQITIPVSVKGFEQPDSQ